MVLTTVRVDKVVPRGGGGGAAAVATGVGFGVVTGTVLFDPLSAHGGPFAATVTLWQDDRIEYTVPAGVDALGNRFYTVLITKNDGSDAGQHPWWVPEPSDTALPPPTSLDLDYQWPEFEAGTPEQDEDNPRKFQAADYNRLLERFLVLTFELQQQGVDAKNACQAGSVGDIGAAYLATGGTSGRGQFTGAPLTVDGVILQATWRVLVKDQSNGDENGIWEVITPGTGSDGVWERATDFDEDHEVTSGALTHVLAGAVNQLTGWVLLTPDPIVIGGTSGTSLFWALVVQAAGTMIRGDKGLFPAATSGDGSPTGLTTSFSPRGYIDVRVRGLSVSVGDGVKTLDCYFSNDGGTTAKALAGIVAGDELIWNGAIAGFDLQAADRVDFQYEL